MYMRFDKLTTKLQQAISEASSIAVNSDNQYIEAQHLLLALIQQTDSNIKPILQRLEINVENQFTPEISRF